MEDIGRLIEKFGIIGAAAGSKFVYKGKLKGVLINYPNNEEKRALIGTYFSL
jgi:cyclase